jgi:hypothetical protein
MNRMFGMIGALIWKDWREHRAKYLFYWVALNTPILAVAAVLAVSPGARTPFADLSDGTALKYLPLALGVPLVVSTLLLLATGYLAVATFTPEIEDRTLLFVSEQPVSRQRYVAMKLLIGGVQVVLAVSFAALFAAVVAYGMMLASGRVTAAGTAGAFYAVLGAAARGAVWSSLISLIVFTGSALVAALVPRWWLAAAGSVALTVLLLIYAHDFFSFTADINDNDVMSITMGLHSGSWDWVSVSRPWHLAEVASFAQWRALPLAVAALAAAAFSAAIAQIYGRKELQ